MISKGDHVKFACFVLLAVSEEQKPDFFHSMYNKTIIGFGFCDIQNNQGLSKGYQPQPLALADNPYLNLDYSWYHRNLIQLFKMETADCGLFKWILLLFPSLTVNRKQANWSVAQANPSDIQGNRSDIQVNRSAGFCCD